MLNYWFMDLSIAEDFFVQAESLEKAKKIAETYFDEPEFFCVVDDEEAEMWGFDTY